MSILTPTPASEFKKLHRKIHQLPSGRAVEIRKLKFPDDFPGLQEKMEILAGLKGRSPDAIASLAEKDREVFDLGVMIAEVIITRGVVRPKIYSGDISIIPDDAVHISDLGEDKEDLVKAVLSFSGVSL